MFTKFLPDGRDPELYELLERNWDITRHWFTAALLARAFLFQQFLNKAVSEKATLGNDLRRRWLLAQIQPKIIFGTDILNTLTQLIGGISNIADIETTLSQIWEAVTTLICRLDPSLESSDKRPSLFVIIDEAQDGVTQLPDAFMSGVQAPQDIKRKKRPVLRQLLFTLTSALEKTAENVDVTHIVTGTGISKEMLEDAVSSATYKEQSIAFVPDYNTGGFDHIEDQKSYIAHYLGEGFPQSQIGKPLCSRMWHWLRGRYRFTTEFLSLIIEDAFRNPDALLNAYIYEFGRFHPTDHGKNLSSSDGISSSYSFPFSALQFDKVLDKRDGREKIDNIDAIAYPFFMRSVISGGPLGQDEQDFIEWGIARWRYSTEKSTYKCTISEPLVLLAAAFRISLKDGTPLYKRLTAYIDTNSTGQNHNGFETYLTYFFARTFGRGERLGAVFDLQDCAEKTLGDYDATLVSLYRLDDDSPLEEYPIILFPGRDNPGSAESIEGEDVGPADGSYVRDCGPVHIPGSLAEHAKDHADTARWMHHRTRTAFCYPAPKTGPDLIFVLRLTKPHESQIYYIWVVVQAKFYRAHKSPNMKARDLKDAIRSVTPERFCMDEGDTEDPHERDELKEQNINLEHLGNRQKILEAMTDLTNREPSTGPYGVLRVVASFPQNAKFSLAPEAQTTADRYPLASLNREYLMRRLQHISPTRYLARKDEEDTRARRTNPRASLPPINPKTTQRLGKITLWTKEKSKVSIKAANMTHIQDQIEYIRIYGEWKWIPPANWRINGKEYKDTLSEFLYDVLRGRYSIRHDSSDARVVEDREEIVQKLVKRVNDGNGKDPEYDDRVLALSQHLNDEGENIFGGDVTMEEVNTPKDVEMEDATNEGMEGVEATETGRRNLKRKKRPD
ncbi:hypothetical protein VKT23_012239 [Stygiomarasmius scandens]|uniref:Uncharacterized protein n=1 Tax=Marasmiellus scandens TaxID=2682957 RepID=A0ABR1J9R2_9AGAR